MKYKSLKTPQDIRNLKDDFPFAPNGGWHFSYMGGVDRVLDKMNAIVEGSAIMAMFNGQLDRNVLARKIEAGQDIYCRKDMPDFQMCDIEEIKLPTLKKFVEKYPNFVRR